MNYSRRQLYAMGEPFGDSATRIEGGKRIYGGGGGGGQTSTTATTIPPEFRDLANLYTQQAMQIGQTPWSPYGGQRYSNLTPDQQSAMGMVRDRAMGGSQLMDRAEGNLSQMMQGGSNPQLDAMVGRAQSGVADRFNMMTKPQTEAAMVGSGSFGNTGLEQTLFNQQKAAGQQMGDIASQMYGQAYGQDQDRRMQAIGMSGQFGNRAYQDAGQLMNVGGMQQQQGQNMLDFRFQQSQDAMNNPYRQIQATGGAFGNMPTGSTTTSSGGGK